MNKEEILRKVKLESKCGNDERDTMITRISNSAGYFIMSVVVGILYVIDIFIETGFLDHRVLGLILFSGTSAQLISKYKYYQSKMDLIGGIGFCILTIHQILLLVGVR